MDYGIAPYLFYLFAFMIVVSGILVVTLRDIFHCALMLIICMFSVAGDLCLARGRFHRRRTGADLRWRSIRPDDLCHYVDCTRLRHRN